MIRNYILMGAMTVVCVAPMYGQFGRDQISTRRADIVGSRGDSGKCTIEVRVDQAAEVEVNGDMGRLRTLSGQPASWVRFQCSSPVPQNPSDFRFRGIDGRGDVNLVRDPRSTRGVAVVRIEDPKGGAEGYTFDLEWTGGDSGIGNGSGWGNGRRGGRNDGRYNDRDNDRYNDRYGDRRPARGREDSVVTCESTNGRRRNCSADTAGGVRILREHGNSSCRLGETWGFDQRGIWVDRGCRADFQVGR